MEVKIFNEKAKELKRIVESGKWEVWYGFEEVEGRLVATIRISRSQEPVYLGIVKEKTENGKQ